MKVKPEAAAPSRKTWQNATDWTLGPLCGAQSGARKRHGAGEERQGAEQEGLHGGRKFAAIVELELPALRGNAPCFTAACTRAWRRL